MGKKKALVLVNVGTPDEPKVRSVQRYLTQFLNDRRVIDIPWLARKLLVNLIIIPFRVRNSTKIYKLLWTDKGSPLLIYLNSVVSKLQKKMDEYQVYGAMSYGKPALKKVLKDIEQQQVDELVIFPLYPQYASSTSGSVIENSMKIIQKWEVIPKLRFTEKFYDHPKFIEAFYQKIKSYDPSSFDHVLFSYHGLPTRHIDKVHPKVACKDCTCSIKLPAHGKYCYHGSCRQTTRFLVEKLGLKEGEYTTSFQSRLSKNWLTPFSDKVLVDLAKKGVKKVLVTSPAFVADCLETTIEIGYEYKELFIENGGEELVLVESLNDDDYWVDTIIDIVG